MKVVTDTKYVVIVIIRIWGKIIPHETFTQYILMLEFLCTVI